MFRVINSLKERINYLILFLNLYFINFYIASLGLMDDFHYTKLNFLGDINQYVQFLSSDISSGGIRPFLPFQIMLNNLGFYLFSEKGYFIINLLILFLILAVFYSVFNKIFKLNKFLFYILFFCWPYTYDLIIHPSLQEKFIILFITLFIYFVINNHKNNLTVSLLSFSIPLTKIQGLVFFPLIYSVLNSDFNKKNNKIAPLLSFVISSLIVLSIFFYKPETYFNQGIKVDRFFSQVLISPVNLLNIITITASYLSAKSLKLNNQSILKGLILSNFLLIFFMSAYKPIGNYLNSVNIFFIIIYLLIIYEYLENRFKSTAFKTATKFISLILFTVVLQLFGIPRFERMNSINDVINYQSDSKSEIYYSCQEGVEYLNNVQKNNLFMHLENFQTVENTNFLFLSDPFECNNVENIISQKCDIDRVTKFEYENSMKIIQYQC